MAKIKTTTTQEDFYSKASELAVKGAIVEWSSDKKTCTYCGHQETLTLENFNEHKDNFPEGFDGAVRVYYNLNI